MTYTSLVDVHPRRHPEATLEVARDTAAGDRIRLTVEAGPIDLELVLDADEAHDLAVAIVQALTVRDAPPGPRAGD